jgi:DegV family protein with EDD domain
MRGVGAGLDLSLTIARLARLRGDMMTEIAIDATSPGAHRPIRIVTDSLAWLPAEVVRQYDVTVVPLHVSFGDEQFTETVDITNEEFYRRLRTGSVQPTTSQPSPGEFLDAYRRISSTAGAVISIHASAKLSGTYGSAQVAAGMARSEFPGVRYEVFDTKVIAPAQGMVVVAATEAAARGESVEAVLELIAALAPRTNAMVSVETLEYLIRGGRLGRVAGFIGGMLNVRPILSLADGSLTARERVRTRPRALDRLVELMAEDVPSGRLGHLGLMHAEAPEVRDELRRRVLARFEVEREFSVEIGPVLGTHAGPGAFGVTYHPAD